MTDGIGFAGGVHTAALSLGNWSGLLSSHIGQTVTIFTSSGGQSGAGFTGVLLAVNPGFVRLITKIGPPPGCAIGNACTGFGVGYGGSGAGGYGAGYGAKTCGCGAGYGGTGFGGGYGQGAPASELGAATAGGWDGYPVYTVGSVTDIPVASIVSFVHNAV